MSFGRFLAVVFINAWCNAFASGRKLSFILKLLAFLAGILGVGYVASLLGQVPLLLAGMGIAFFIFLLSEAHQLYLAEHKKVVDLQTAQTAKEAEEQVTHHQKPLAYAALSKLKHELRDSIEHFKTKFPSGASNLEVAILESAFNANTKNTLINWLTRARQETDKVKLSGYLAAVSELETIPLDRYKLEKFAERQLEIVEVILEKLQ